MLLTKDELYGLIVSALEGGSNYWYFIDKKTYPKTISYIDWKKISPPENINDYYKKELYIGEIPLNSGGNLQFRTIEESFEPMLSEDKFDLNLKSLRKGSELFKKQFPVRFKSVKHGQYDAIDADIFLQLCLFEDVIYG